MRENGALLQIAKETPIDIRFIEMMPIGHGSRKASVSNQELLEKIRGKYGEMTEEAKKQQSGGRGAFSGHGNGPAVYYQIPGFREVLDLLAHCTENSVTAAIGYE